MPLEILVFHSNAISKSSELSVPVSLTRKQRWKNVQFQCLPPPSPGLLPLHSLESATDTTICKNISSTSQLREKATSRVGLVLKALCIYNRVSKFEFREKATSLVGLAKRIMQKLIVHPNLNCEKKTTSLVGPAKRIMHIIVYPNLNYEKRQPLLRKKVTSLVGLATLPPQSSSPLLCPSGLATLPLQSSPSLHTSNSYK